MSDYTVYCHCEHKPFKAAEHYRSETHLYGSPKWGGLWHCPAHADQGITTSRWHDFPKLTCGCPYDPTYSDPLPEGTDEADHAGGDPAACYFCSTDEETSR